MRKRRSNIAEKPPIHCREHSNVPTQHVSPFLKWPGGKRWIAGSIARVIAAQGRLESGRYIEPFLGSGAVFFRVAPRRAILGDVNRELIDTYRAVKLEPDEVVSLLKTFRVSRRSFHSARMSKPRSRTGRAARFLFLNRTAFAGLYRVNADGVFNVPYGGGERTPAPLWERNLIRNASRLLDSATLLHADFECLIARARRNDVVYCDPIYTVAHDNNGFVRYNEKCFSWEDQMRLSHSCNAAVRRGCLVIVSNAHHESVRRLYRGWQETVVRRVSTVACDPRKRRVVRELVFVRNGQ